MWNEAKITYTCPKCGRTVVLRSNSRIGLCPDCDAYSDRRGRFAGGFSQRMKGPGKVSNIWSDGAGLSIYYCEGSGRCLVYWMGEIIGGERIEPLLKAHGYVPGCRVTCDGHPGLAAKLKSLAMRIHSERGKLPELKDRESRENECLVLFRGGMTPLAISIRLSMAFSEVMEIISHRSGNGVAVQDGAQRFGSARYNTGTLYG